MYRLTVSSVTASSPLAISLCALLSCLTAAACGGDGNPCADAIANIESCAGQSLGVVPAPKTQCGGKVGCEATCTAMASCQQLGEYASTDTAPGSFGDCLARCAQAPTPLPSPSEQNVCQRGAALFNSCGGDQLSGEGACTGQDACRFGCMANSSCKEISEWVNGSVYFENDFSRCFTAC